MNTAVKDVMTSRVIWMEQDTPYAAIAAAFEQYRVSAFPVLDQAGQVIGVVSEADLLAKEALADGQAGIPGAVTGLLHRKQQEKADALTAGEMMTHPAVTVRPDDTVEHAARMMYTLQVKRLPVVDAGGHLIGIVSRSDVLAVFDRPDSEILAEITDDVILHEFLIDPAMFVVTIRDGVVTIRGNLESANLGHQLVAKIRSVRGVVAVRDELTYPPAERSVAGLYF